MSFKRIIKNVQGLCWCNSVTNGDNAGVMSLLSNYGTGDAGNRCSMVRLAIHLQALPRTRHSIKWSVMGC